MVKSYKDLHFWQKSFETTKQILGLIKKLPMEQMTKIVVNQLIRASCSVGANIAEGYGRYRGKEYERFLQIALGSANETEYWLLILKELYPKSGVEIDKIIGMNNETIGMLVSSLKTLRSKK